MMGFASAIKKKVKIDPFGRSVLINRDAANNV